MKRIIAVVLLSGLSLTAAAEIAVPEKAAACAACHGEGGAKPITPNYPILAGQYANYLEHTLKEYRSGVRKNPVMSAQAVSLTDKEIKELSHYFDRYPSTLHTPNVHATAGAAHRE
ncbi:MAG: cytochrome c [Pseudomonadota bacterium]|nr:cytochrome c [Pseudomonadota bacterium]